MNDSPVLQSIREERLEEVDRLLNEGFYRELFTAPRELRTAFELLPDDWFDTHPRHRMTRALARAAGPGQLVDDDAFADFAEWVRGQRDPDTRDLLGIEATHLRRAVALGNRAEAVGRADAIRRRIRDASDTKGFSDVLPSLLLRVGVVYLQTGDLTAAADSFHGARRFAADEATHPVDPYLRSHLALVDAIHDHFADARERLLDIPTGAPDDIDPASLPGQLRAADLQVRALIAVSSGTRAHAERALDDMGSHGGLTDLWWVGVLARARAIAQWGEPHDGISLMRRELRDHASGSAPDLLAGQLLAAELATLHQLVGDLAAADAVLEPLGDETAVFAVRAAKVRMLLLRGDVERGEELLRESCPGDLSSPSAAALLLTVEHLRSRSVPARSVADVARVLETNAAAYAAQQIIRPVREQVLRAAAPGRERFGASMGYPAPRAEVTLSGREQQVLAALRLYSRSTDIAAHLHVSVNTIKTHRKNLYLKLGVNGRADALAVAERLWGEDPDATG